MVGPTYLTLGGANALPSPYVPLPLYTVQSLYCFSIIKLSCQIEHICPFLLLGISLLVLFECHKYDKMYAWSVLNYMVFVFVFASILNELMCVLL